GVGHGSLYIERPLKTSPRGVDTGSVTFEPLVSQSPRVVVVDDHDVFRNGLVSLLSEHGIEVVGDAADGENAIRLVARVAPDVVVMDLNLPGISGLEAI